MREVLPQCMTGEKVRTLGDWVSSAERPLLVDHQDEDDGNRDEPY